MSEAPMSASRDDIIRHLNDYLHIGDFKDYGPQGLQVEGRETIKKIVTSVSASIQLFEEAAGRDADMVIVHHGILWDKESRVISGGFKRRIETLLYNEITLLAYHLPLDKHPEVGNNAIAAKAFNMSNLSEFAEVGLKGDIPLCSFDNLLKKVQDVYNTDPLVFAYGPERIERIGICSGGADHYIQEAVSEGLDAFVTGEFSEPTMHLAKEGHIHFIGAGHYATERLGVLALGAYLSNEFSVDVEFVDIYNPV
jgi:dinuclear metal center YbgI/SA1388 family protein